MKLSKIKNLLEAEVVTGEYNPEEDILIGCSSDLMSEILAFGKPGSILLTSLTNIQVINTANVSDIKVVCFVMGKNPDKVMVKSAMLNGVTVLKTRFTTFESCGLLYKNGLKSCSYLPE